jgi:hypothetical protein
LSFKNFVNLCLGILFTGFLLYQLYKQKERKDNFFQASYKGIVVSTEKGNKGYYDVRVLTEGEEQALGIHYKNDNPLIFSGDSIFKPPSSKDIFLKKYDDSVFRKQDVNVLP